MDSHCESRVNTGRLHLKPRLKLISRGLNPSLSMSFSSLRNKIADRLSQTGSQIFAFGKSRVRLEN